MAKTAGFCFGVKRAVEFAYDACGEKGKQYITYGDIIHNTQVVDDLAKKGIRSAKGIDQIPNNCNVIIRAHGVGEDILDKLKDKQCEIFDMTCPYVNKIHKIVREKYREGYEIVIIGDKNHPEVVGINGCCKYCAYIVDKIGDFDVQLLNREKICVVAQTTFRKTKYNQIVEFINANFTHVIIEDTICSATDIRQTETKSLAEKCDVMVVVGGKKSSNTQKLVEICKSVGKQTYSIETFEDFPQNINLYNKKIGITAGASTPNCIIEEVISKMENQNMEEMSFAEMFEQSLKTLNTGDITTGTVVEVRDNEVIVDLGIKSDGTISFSEFTEDPNAKLCDLVSVNDVIEVFVVGVNDSEGKTILSKKKLDAIAGYEAIKTANENGGILEGRVIQIVKGGMIVLCSASRVFIPASLASERYIEDLSDMMGKTVSFKIIELDERKRRIKGSVKAVLIEQRKVLETAFWADVEIGKKYTGTVKSITNFGAFVDIGGVDGLVHISELSWNRIKHPSEIVKAGDIVEVYIKDLDAEKRKISLGFKKIEDNPWNVAKEKFNVDDVVSCKVVRMLPFGAFVELMPSVDGLIHISQIANKRIAKPADVLEIGQVVEAKITDIDWENRKLNLSVRALLPEEAVVESEGKTADTQSDEPTSYTEEMNVTLADTIKIEE